MIRSGTKPFRYTPHNHAGSRRLADSNRCKYQLETACLNGSRSSSARATDFVTPSCPYSTGAATAPAPGLPHRPGGSYPCSRDHRRGSDRAHLPAARSSRRTVADVAGGPPLPLPSPLARHERRVVHPPSRGGGLARTTQPEQPRRNADHLVDLGLGWWPGGPGGLVGAGAGVPGLSHLVSGRRVVS